MHVSVAPLVLTLLTSGEANVGLVLDAVPQHSAAIEPLRSVADGAVARSSGLA